jgi:hypothetical protein
MLMRTQTHTFLRASTTASTFHGQSNPHATANAKRGNAFVGITLLHFM